MKRFLLIMILLLIVISTIGCSSGAYSYEEAIKKGDIVYQVKADNLERFEKFLDNLSNKKEDTIRVTSYTKKGTLFLKTCNSMERVFNILMIIQTMRMLETIKV